MRFQHQVVAITGAAQGIGRQTAEQAAREGARLLLIDRSRYVHELAATLAEGGSDVLALEEVADFLVFHMEQAGRVKLKCSPLPLDRLEPPAVETRTIRDTVSSLRLDAVASSGFSLARSKMADAISSGKVALNGRECVKPDRTVAEGDVITCRGLGKCVLKEVSGPSKKGRTMIVIERYV